MDGVASHRLLNSAVLYCMSGTCQINGEGCGFEGLPEHGPGGSLVQGDPRENTKSRSALSSLCAVLQNHFRKREEV